MSDFIVGFFVGSIVAALICMFKFKGIYERHTNQLIEIRNERNKYHALYEINADRAKSFVKHMQNAEPDPAIKESAERGRATLARMNQISSERLLAEARTSHRKRIADLEYALELILCLNEDAETMTGHERDERATVILEKSNG